MGNTITGKWEWESESNGLWNVRYNNYYYRVEDLASLVRDNLDKQTDNYTRMLNKFKTFSPLYVDYYIHYNDIGDISIVKTSSGEFIISGMTNSRIFTGVEQYYGTIADHIIHCIDNPHDGYIIVNPRVDNSINVLLKELGREQLVKWIEV